MPILAQNSVEIISRSTEQTRRVGMRLGGMLDTGDLVCLVGDLGSGKTTLVQGIAAGWGSLDQVTSPTFVLVNLYRKPKNRRLYHMDAYRMNSPAEAEDLDIIVMLESGPLVVEWAERVQAVLPAEGLWATLKYVDQDQRDLVFSARGERYKQLVVDLRRQLFGG
jgi:tRNA threonylcarbamoyladenosine biosynthesis protein TsaE